MASNTDELALPERLLGQEGGWRLLGGYDGEDIRAPALQAAFQHFFEASAVLVQARWPLPAGTVVHVVMGGDQAAIDWNGDDEALGFQALVANLVDEDSGEESLWVPDDFRCYVNLDALLRALEIDEDDVAARAAALATLPHEMAHVALLAQATQGQSPASVANEKGIEILSELIAQAEADAFSAGHDGARGAAEDQAETFAGEAVDQWLAQSSGARQALAQIQVKASRARAKRGTTLH